MVALRITALTALPAETASGITAINVPTASAADQTHRDLGVTPNVPRCRNSAVSRSR